MDQQRVEQLAVLLEIESAVKLAKAAWLRDDRMATGKALNLAAEHLARFPNAENEISLAT